MTANDLAVSGSRSRTGRPLRAGIYRLALLVLVVSCLCTILVTAVGGTSVATSDATVIEPSGDAARHGTTAGLGGAVDGGGFSDGVAHAGGFGVEDETEGEASDADSGDDGGDEDADDEDADDEDADDRTRATIERDGDAVVATVPTDRIETEGRPTFEVVVPELDASAEANATRTNGGYVATVPVADLVPEDVDRALDSELVAVRHDGTSVATGAVDLRYVAIDDASARFEGVSIALDADVRGLGTGEIEFVLPAENFATGSTTLRTHQGSFSTGNVTVDASVQGIGPNATVIVGPNALGRFDPAATYDAAPAIDGSPLVADRVELGIAGPAANATAFRYVDGELVLVQPLAYPAIGNGPVDLRVDTWAPDATYAIQHADERGVVPVSDSVLGAEAATVTASVDGTTVVSNVTPESVPQEHVPLRIENGSLHAPQPGALDPYDVVVVREEGVVRVPLEDDLRDGEPQPLPPGAASIDDGDAILLGGEGRPAAVDLTVIALEGDGEEPLPDEPPGPPEPDADEFVGLWAQVGSGAALLLIAMIGGTTGLALAFVLRLGYPASTGRMRLRIVPVHLLLGGAFGFGAIWLLGTSPWWDPSLGSVAVAGIEIGAGALVVGGGHGGLTATGLRLGLGAADVWPSDERTGPATVPVRVTVTDDAGDAVPGEQTIVAQRPAGHVGERASIGGTTTELELMPGEWRLTATVGDRESDSTTVRLPEPSSASPEVRTARLTLQRPRLGVEVADASTGDPVDDATVAVTTDAGKTRSEEIDEGHVRLPLPLETAAVRVEMRADGYESERIERRLDRDRTAIEADLDPATGRLEARAVVDDVAVPGVPLRIDPGGSDPPTAGVPSATVETGDGGTTTATLPIGTYRVRLTLDGPNAGLFDVRDGIVAVERDATAGTTVRGRFNWALDPGHGDHVQSLRATVDAVADEASTDPTIPLYFASVATDLLDAAEALSDAGHLFATTHQRPDAVAAATVTAAEATLGAVGRAMQQDTVQRTLAASDGDPRRLSPEVDVDPADVLAHLDGDVGGPSVGVRADEVTERVDAEATTLGSVAPARAVVATARELPANADAGIERALLEYAALGLLDAVEAMFERGALRERLDA